MNLCETPKILVIGSPGSGKSRFSRILGEKTGIPVIHLDKEYWHPGWVGTPKPEWREKVIGFLSGDRWIIDGDYSGTLDLRTEACDLIFYFDLPRLTCLRGVLERFGKPRPDIALLAIEKAGYQKEDAVLVGDRIYTDIACGVNAGITTVLVFSGETTREDLEKSEVKPSFSCQSVKDLWELLK